jgi:hypothetical protein
MKQRKWTVEQKLAIVMEGLKEKRSVAEICREHWPGTPVTPERGRMPTPLSLNLTRHKDLDNQSIV